MENIIRLESYKTFKAKPSTNDTREPNDYIENALKPVTLNGVIVPWTEEIKYGYFSDHKLVCNDGREYFFVSDSYWKSVLSCHCWDEVKVKGLLNSATGVLSPQLIYPKGPMVQNNNPVELATSSLKKFAKRIGKHLNELVIIPAGLLVMFMAL